MATDGDTLTSLSNALASRKSHRLALPRNSYPLDSPPGSQQDLLNLFAEFEPTDARSSMFLRSTPGLIASTDFTAPSVTAIHDLHGFLYVLAGTRAFRLVVGNPPAILGTVLDNPLSTIAVGPNQAVFCTPPNAYICDHSSGAISQITSSDLPPVSSVTFLDGYFIFSEVDSGRFHTSKLTSGGDFDPFAFASVEAMPDVVVRVIAHRGMLLLFGHDSIEFWQDIGATPVAFQRISGGVVYGGTISPASIASFNGTLGWLGRDSIVYALNGFSAARISHSAMEQANVSYGDFQNARGCAYSQEGHWFYALTFPTPGKTWVYDASTELWHRRSSASGGTDRWRANCAAMFGQVPVVGDFESGKIFFLQPDIGTDNGTQIPRMAVFPPLSYEGRRLFMNRLEIEMETGTYLTPDMVLLDWSDDGYTFGPTRTLNPAANTGAYKTRVFTTRLGSFRRRTYRLRMPGNVTIYAADIDLSVADGMTYNPGSRR